MKRIVLKKKSENKNSKLSQMETLSSKQLLAVTGGAKKADAKKALDAFVKVTK